MRKTTDGCRSLRIAVVLIAVMAGGAAAFVGNRAPAAEPTSEVMGLEKRLLDALYEGDKPTVAALTADDFMLISEEGRDNKTEILELVEKIPAEQRSKTFDMKAHAIAPDVVVVTYKLAAEESDENGVWFSSVWTRRDGRWLNVFAQTTVPSPKPEPVPPPK